jgi:hypothetical protein
MSLIAIAAASALMTAAVPTLPAGEQLSAPANGGQVILAGTGYFRRDLGLDPQWERQHGYYRENHGSRGFRHDGAATTPPAGSSGVIIYEDPGTGDYIWYFNGLRIHTGDPALLEPGGR